MGILTVFAIESLKDNLPEKKDVELTCSTIYLLYSIFWLWFAVLGLSATEVFLFTEI